MFLIVRADGKFWDGYGWNTKGKVFFTVAGATRSLHEEGEDSEESSILPADFVKLALSIPYDTAQKLP